MAQHDLMTEKDGRPPARSEDRVLLDEAHHRTANEVAAAIAAMRIARKSRGPRSRALLIDRAIDRLEAFGECNRLLAAPYSKAVDLGATLDTMCRAIVRSRHDGPRRVVLKLPHAVVDGPLARRMTLIAYELVTNALKYAFTGPEGELEVRLSCLAGDLVLSVIDDGPGLGVTRSSLTSSGRLGGVIVGELVQAVNGAFECETGPDGTAIHVAIPFRPGSAMPAGHR